MRVGVVVRMEADTDIDEKFAEVPCDGHGELSAGMLGAENYQR